MCDISNMVAMGKYASDVHIMMIIKVCIVH